MAAATEYLLANADFKNTEKHAQSFSKLITNANFRSIFTWCKEEMLNRRKGMVYGAITSLPEEMKVWIGEERARHIRHFQVEVATLAEKAIPSQYDGTEWMARFRKTFTESSSELYNKVLWASIIHVEQMTLI